MKPLYTIIFSLLICSQSFCQTFNCNDTLIDTRDGKKYATVLIGSDCWFKQNLNYGLYIPSDSLGVIHSQQTNNGIPEKYAQLNDTNNLLIYGGLYEQEELMNYLTSPQGLCPNGWHVSTDQEWQSLITTAGGNLITATAGNGGNALKQIGEGFGAGSGTDLVGISLKHGGDRDGYGIFYGMGLRAIYWTSTISMPGQAYQYTLWAENDTIERLILPTTSATGFSCRCVKDQPTGINTIPQGFDFNIFPNPASSTIDITDLHSDDQIFIYNSIDQLVYSEKLNAGQNSTLINITSWRKNLYLIKVMNADKGLVGYKKLIIE